MRWHCCFEYRLALLNASCESAMCQRTIVSSFDVRYGITLSASDAVESDMLMDSECVESLVRVKMETGKVRFA